MEGKSTIDIYLNFHIDWIIDFSKTLLPKQSLKKIDFNHFKKTLIEYYVNAFIRKNRNVFDQFEDKNLIIDSLIKLKITNKKIQELYVSLFKEDVIISWANNTKQQEMQDLCNFLVTTIFIAMELLKNIGPAPTEKITYKKVIKEILCQNKFISLETIKLFNEYESKLSVLYESALNKNFKFIKKYNSSNVFSDKYLKVYETKDNSSTDMYLSKIKYSINELKNENKKEVLKASLKDKNLNNIKKIEFELVTFEIFKKLFYKKNIKIFIDINDSFLKSKSNITFMEKKVSIVRENIFLNINYDTLLNYNKEISELKEKGYNISISKGIKDIDFRKLYDIKYCFLKLEDSISFSKTLNQLSLGKIEPILTDIEEIELNLGDRNVNYYVK